MDTVRNIQPLVTLQVCRYRKATKHNVSTLEMQQAAVANVTRSIFTTIVIIIVHFICGCLS